MPTHIGVVGTDGTVATGVAANYLKAKPSTQFGTRQLSVLTIAKEGLIVNTGTTYLDPDSLYSKIVRALQQTAEVWAIFTPVENSTDPDSFNVIISTDSQWNGVAQDTSIKGGAAGNGSYDSLAAALNAGADTTGITVAVPAGFVAPFSG